MVTAEDEKPAESEETAPDPPAPPAELSLEETEQELSLIHI